MVSALTVLSMWNYQDTSSDDLEKTSDATQGAKASTFTCRCHKNQTDQTIFRYQLFRLFEIWF